MKNSVIEARGMSWVILMCVISGGFDDLWSKFYTSYLGIRCECRCLFRCSFFGSSLYGGPREASAFGFWLHERRPRGSKLVIIKPSTLIDCLFNEAVEGAIHRAMVNDPAASGRSANLALKVVTWLILPVVICLSQRLSHACLSISNCTAKLRMAH